MLTSLMIPPMTTYEQDGETIGKKMAETLIENIEKGSDYTPQKFLITGRLLKGGSIAQISQS